MTMITELIQQECIHNKDLGNVMTASLKIDELGLYLKNLDKQAEIYQEDQISVANKQKLMALEQQQNKLENQLKSQVLEIIRQYSQGDLDALRSQAEQINCLLADDIDIIDLLDGQKEFASKAYLITKIIAEHAQDINNYTQTI